mmetsp:Transcript_128858/g.240987  ORF Transcript_128858/g.240987 Transcript_128858/m.240987 type:complete len:208 (-) Transcript_128858:104-727(-)
MLQKYWRSHRRGICSNQISSGSSLRNCCGNSRPVSPTLVWKPSCMDCSQFCLLCRRERFLKNLLLNSHSCASIGRSHSRFHSGRPRGLTLLGASCWACVCVLIYMWIWLLRCHRMFFGQRTISIFVILTSVPLMWANSIGSSQGYARQVMPTACWPAWTFNLRRCKVMPTGPALLYVLPVTQRRAVTVPGPFVCCLCAQLTFGLRQS